jgi:hypothetical protein
MRLNLSRKIFLALSLLGLASASEAAVFNSARELSFPSTQFTVATADLNEDGIPDLVIGGDPISGEYGKIRVGLGIGNGNFRNWREYIVGFNFIARPRVSGMLRPTTDSARPDGE